METRGNDNGAPEVSAAPLNAQARFLTRHLFDQADFLPYRDRILAARRDAWING